MDAEWYNIIRPYKNWRTTSPTGMGSPFDSEQLSEFQINTVSNNRDIRKYQSFRTTPDDDARAMTIPRRFLRKQPS